MRSGESIGFSVRLCTFFAEQDRIFATYLREEDRVSYSELTLLAALYEARDPVALEPLADFIMLSPRTVRTMLLDLEDKGLVAKYDDPADSRYMLAGLSDAGKTTVEKSVADIYFLTKESFWEALPESDFENNLKQNMRRCVNYLRGCAVNPFGEYPHTELPMAADHLIFWRVVVDRWSQAVRREGGISLNDFRALYYLYECGELSPSEMADALFLPRSALSLSKKNLLERGLVKEDASEEDGRRLTLSCTPKGKRTAKTLFGVLDNFTRDAHSSMSEEDAYLVNAWYARMFSNMRRLRK